MAITRKANRKYPSLPIVSEDTASHSAILTAIKSALEIGQRRTSDFLSSFVQVRDLVDLGIIDVSGNLNEDFGGGGGNSDASFGDVALNTVLGRNGPGAGEVEQLTMDELRAMLHLGSGQEVRGASFVGFNQEVTAGVQNVAIHIKEDCTIVKCVVLTMGGEEVNGECVVDIWKEDFDDYPATVDDSICPTNKPTVASGEVKYSDDVLTDWTTALSADDTLIITLEENDVFTAVFVFLVLEPVGSQATDGYTDERTREIVEEALEDLLPFSVPAVPDTIPVRDGDAYLYAATPPDGDSSDKVATTEFVNAGSDFITDGYFIHANGFIEQWGFDTRAGSAAQTVTFPIPFPNACLNIQLTNYDTGGSSGQASSLDAAPSASTTSFQLNHADAIVGTYWRAIGH